MWADDMGWHLKIGVLCSGWNFEPPRIFENSALFNGFDTLEHVIEFRCWNGQKAVERFPSTHNKN
jgi:hypothetical protein